MKGFIKFMKVFMLIGLIVFVGIPTIVGVLSAVFAVNKKNSQVKKCEAIVGYTVLDSNRVITSCGDTVEYDFKKNIRIKPL
jgi:hypothetical protein